MSSFLPEGWSWGDWAFKENTHHIEYNTSIQQTNALDVLIYIDISNNSKKPIKSSS